MILICCKRKENNPLLRLVTYRVDRWHSRGISFSKQNPFLLTDSGNTEGGWSEWSEWTECSRQCGGGRQQKTRTCDGYRSSDCDGPNMMERVCNLQSCKGVWGCWTDWSPCTVTCGQGTRSRSRTCSVEGGDPAGVNELDIEGCAGPTEMKEYCNNPSCERK